ncbi:MAG: hypothetical protein ACKO1F_07605 [Flammeovirgaceae bacterium]
MYKLTKSNPYAQRLSGRDGEKIGLTRSISVMPGDKINIEVYAKYYNPAATNDPGLASLISAIISGINVPAGTFVDGVGYGHASSLPFTPSWGAKDGTGAPPMAYLNWMVFDRNYSQDLGRSGYMRITTNAKETGTLVLVGQKVILVVVVGRLTNNLFSQTSPTCFRKPASNFRFCRCFERTLVRRPA